MKLIEEFNRVHEQHAKTKNELDSLYERLISELERKDMELSNFKQMADSYKKKYTEQRILFENALVEKENLIHSINYQKYLETLRQKKGESESSKDNERKMEKLESLTKSLRDKMEREMVPLGNVVDAIQERAKILGIPAAYQLFLDINDIFGEVTAWKKTQGKLKKFFQDEAKNNKEFVLKDPHFDSLYSIKDNTNVNLGGLNND